MEQEELLVQVLSDTAEGVNASSTLVEDHVLATSSSNSEPDDTKLLQKAVSPITKFFGDKKHKCKMCGAVFSKKLDMHIHRLTHADANDIKQESKDDSSIGVESHSSNLNENHSSAHSIMERQKESNNEKNQQENVGLTQNDQNHFIKTHGQGFPNQSDILLDKNLNSKQIQLDMSVRGSKEYEDMMADIFASDQTKLHLDVLVPGPRRTYQCAPCDKRFEDYGEYLHHREDHPNPKLFKCRTCSKGFTIKGNLTRHEQIHGDIRLFKCSVCEKKFSQKTHLVTHLGTHTRRPFYCKSCRASFTKEYSLNKHLMYEHGVINYASSESSKSDDMGTAESGFPEKSSNDSEDCNSEVDLTGVVRKHEVLMMPADLGNDSDSSLEKYYKNIHYTCGTCYVVFSDFHSYIGHKKEHPTPKLYECELCHKSFTVKGNLQRHQQIHQDIRLHQCDTCTRKFSQKTHLEAHMLVHSKERPYLCATCNSSFTREGNLRRHIKIHTNTEQVLSTTEDEKLPVIFQCAECSKTFMRKGNLKRHQKVHTS